MQYGTIAVYGSGWRVHAGLADRCSGAACLSDTGCLKLAEYDQSFPWRAIGEGIMDSAVEQMLMVTDKAQTGEKVRMKRVIESNQKYPTPECTQTILFF